MTLENNFESTVPTLLTNTKRIHVYVLNDPVPSQIEEIQIEQILPGMNHMYQVPMKIEHEVLNNQF